MDARDEAQLMRMARQYQETEQKKSLRWFPALGDEIPTDADVQREAMLRQAKHETNAAAKRAVDRDRDVAEVDKYAVVPADDHPAFDLSPDEAAAQRPASFATAAAETVERKKHLHKAFMSGLWVQLARMRAERRLQRMASAQRMRQASAVPDGQAANDAIAAKKASAAGTAGRVASLTKGKSLVSGGSTTTAAGGRGAPGNPTDGAAAVGGGVAARSTYDLGIRNISMLTIPALPPDASSETSGGAAASTGALASVLGEEGPSAADSETFLERDLKAPFEFKLRHYTRFKFTEHHFATCDPPQVPPNFPAGLAEAAEANADEPVPCLPSFTQPSVTLERFPGPDFAFKRIMPHEGLVLGAAPQPVTTGGFKDPHFDLDYSQVVPSAAKVADSVRVTVVGSALPAPMKKPDAADDVSDDDDEDDDVALPKASSLVSIAASLPAFSDATVDRRASAGTSSAVGVGDVRGESMLAFEPRPVHNTGTVGTNDDVARSLAASAAALDAVATGLPAPFRINF